MATRTYFQGRRIILTGASSGIGWALAEELARLGARQILAARSADKLNQVVEEIKALDGEAVAVPTDVARAEDRLRLIAEAIRALGGIDMLINNAGVGASGFFAEASEKRLRQVFEINFFGTTELTRLALPHLAAGRDPMIVNVSSVIGRRGVPGYTEYCASKFAMCGWSEALRAELKGQGIHVLLVCPGLIATPFRENQLEDRLRFKWQERRRMSAEACARHIVRAMRKRKNEVVITFGGKLLVWANRLTPWLVDWLAARYSRKARLGE
jgi:short-subunit dehydrogenase